MSGTAQTLGLTAPDPTQALGIDPANPVPPQMPGLGPLPGQLSLNPQIAPQVQGNARPLAPGEYLTNPDGSWSSEMTYTVPFGDGWAVLPGMWIVDGKPVRVSEDQAAEYAKQSGLDWQSYPDEATAEKASQEREATWQTMKPQDAGREPPLWLGHDPAAFGDTNAIQRGMRATPQSSGGEPSGFVGTLDRIRPMSPTDRNMPTRIPGPASLTFGTGSGPEGGILGPTIDPGLEKGGTISPQFKGGPTQYQPAGFVQPSDLQGVTPWDQSTPEQMRLAGGLTPDQVTRFMAAAQAHKAAVQNMIRERPGGQNLIDQDLSDIESSPNAAAAYPAW